MASASGGLLTIERGPQVHGPPGARPVAVVASPASAPLHTEVVLRNIRASSKPHPP